MHSIYTRYCFSTVHLLTKNTGFTHLNNLQNCSISEQKKCNHGVKVISHPGKQTLRFLWPSSNSALEWTALVLGCDSVVSAGADCTPPRSSGRDAGRSEELCSVSAEHLSTSSSLARPGSRRFSHGEIYYFHFLNPPYRQMQHKLMQYEIESAVE